MTELEYHILLTLTCLAPVFIGCILALYLRQCVLWEKYRKLEKHLTDEILEKVAGKFLSREWVGTLSVLALENIVHFDDRLQRLEHDIEVLSRK